MRHAHEEKWPGGTQKEKQNRRKLAAQYFVVRPLIFGFACSEGAGRRCRLRLPPPMSRPTNDVLLEPLVFTIYEDA